VQQDVVDLLECPNCSTPLSPRYSPQCGQKVGEINPTMHDLLHDVTHEFLHVDSKIFRTVALLLLKPGFLTCEYFEGRRVRYVSPIRVYLVFSVIYFAAATSIERPIFRSDENVEVGALGAALGLEDTSPEEANRLMADVQAHWIPRLMFVLVPISALVVQLATRRTGRNYPQHLSFALHIHAAELHRIASRCMAGERMGHSLQATALVNEAYVRLLDVQHVSWQNRARFLAMAARLMRRILVDVARSKRHQKRGSEGIRA
jgi:ECF sigma factor/Protein of unknown function (DUF3667)